MFVCFSSVSRHLAKQSSKQNPDGAFHNSDRRAVACEASTRNSVLPLQMELIFAAFMSTFISLIFVLTR